MEDRTQMWPQTRQTDPPKHNKTIMIRSFSYLLVFVVLVLELPLLVLGKGCNGDSDCQNGGTCESILDATDHAEVVSHVSVLPAIEETRAKIIAPQLPEPRTVCLGIR